MITLLTKEDIGFKDYTEYNLRQQKIKTNAKFKSFFNHAFFKEFKNKGNGSTFKIDDVKIKSIGKYVFFIHNSDYSYGQPNKFHQVYYEQKYSHLESLVYDEVNKLLIVNDSIAIKTNLLKPEFKNG